MQYMQHSMFCNVCIVMVCFMLQASDIAEQSSCCRSHFWKGDGFNIA